MTGSDLADHIVKYQKGETHDSYIRTFRGSPGRAAPVAALQKHRIRQHLSQAVSPGPDAAVADRSREPERTRQTLSETTIRGTARTTKANTMSDENASKISVTKSILFKITAIFGVVTTLILVPLILFEFQTATNKAEKVLTDSAAEVTSQASREVSMLLQMRDKVSIADALAAVRGKTDETLVTITVFDRAGILLAVDGPQNSTLNNQAQKALNSGETSVSADGLLVVVPIKGMGDGPLNGVVATAWTTAPLRASVQETALQSFLIALLMFTLGTLLTVWLVRRMVTRPLIGVSSAMQDISASQFDTNVPALDRTDEVGVIAKTLDMFRKDLASGDQARRESAFKGAAFETTSAAMMIANIDFEITDMNQATTELMTENQEKLSKIVADFDVNRLVGRSIDIFHRDPARIRRLLENTNNLPHTAEIRIENSYFSLNVNAVRNRRGHHIGYLLEWKDVTEVRTGMALINALDNAQCKAEFDLNGIALKVNDNFSALVGIRAAAIAGKNKDQLFSFARETGTGNRNIWNRVLKGETVSGTFAVPGTGSTPHLIEGTFSPVNNSAGAPFGVILLAKDVTREHEARAAAEEERFASQAAQADVVETLRRSLKSLSTGDLTATIDTRFEADYESLRRDFNSAITHLRDAMSSVVDNADMIRSEASEISGAADDLSKRTERQASTLEETATALDELTSSVRSAADGAGLASKMVSQAKSNAEEGGQVVQQAVQAMGQIETSSSQISRITSVIDDIAFQTNLLALNAGVEAARAGDAGRGFAVVASEVRALAQRSSDAAREINDLIAKSGTHVQSGVSLVDATGKALAGIVTSVTEVASHVEEIAVSAQQQSSGLAEINAAVNQLDQVTQQNAAMFEETTAASHALTREAESLGTTVGQFNTGNVATATPKPTALPVAKAKAKPAPRAVTPAKTAAPIAPPAQAAAPKLAVNQSPPAPANANSGGWEDF
jgi:methyl-accepting chemotaxis protein